MSKGRQAVAGGRECEVDSRHAAHCPLRAALPCAVLCCAAAVGSVVTSAARRRIAYKPLVSLPILSCTARCTTLAARTAGRAISAAGDSGRGAQNGSWGSWHVAPPPSELSATARRSAHTPTRQPCRTTVCLPLTHSLATQHLHACVTHERSDLMRWRMSHEQNAVPASRVISYGARQPCDDGLGWNS